MSFLSPFILLYIYIYVPNYINLCFLMLLETAMFVFSVLHLLLYIRISIAVFTGALYFNLSEKYMQHWQVVRSQDTKLKLRLLYRLFGVKVFLSWTN